MPAWHLDPTAVTLRTMRPASNLLVNALGDKGRHVRTAVGVSSLPAGVAVEIDAIFELKP